VTTTGGLPLVGRDAVLAEIKALLDQARASRGGLVLVSGEAGIGKTRLAAEVVNQAHDFRTVWSWCAPAPAGDSFRPWAQMAREFAAADTQVARLVAESPHLSALSKVSREVSAGTAMTMSDAARWQLFDGVAEVVRIAAASQPRLIFSTIFTTPRSRHCGSSRTLSQRCARWRHWCLQPRASVSMPGTVMSTFAPRCSARRLRRDWDG